MRVCLAGRTVQLTDIEYRLLVELSVNAGPVLAYDHSVPPTSSPSLVSATGCRRGERWKRKLREGKILAGVSAHEVPANSSTSLSEAKYGIQRT